MLHICNLQSFFAFTRLIMFHITFMFGAWPLSFIQNGSYSLSLLLLVYSKLAVWGKDVVFAFVIYTGSLCLFSNMTPLSLFSVFYNPSQSVTFPLWLLFIGTNVEIDSTGWSFPLESLGVRRLLWCISSLTGKILSWAQSILSANFKKCYILVDICKWQPFDRSVSLTII